MIRLNFVVEGQTEEAFVNEVLRQHLVQFELICSAWRVSHVRKGRVRGKGGMRTFKDLHRDIERWIREDGGPDARFSSLVDFYGYPKDAPGWDRANAVQDPYQRVRYLEESLANAVDDDRFVPHIQLHEFETMLFAGKEAWDAYFIEDQREVRALFQDISTFSNIEMINDGPGTAPSKRIQRHLPGYQKVTAGIEIAAALGLPRIRQNCPHFDQWLKKLEGLCAK